MEKKTHKFIISGGGTGGHIFPAVSIANALRAKEPDAEILFVGAEGRMEMEKVPQAGYKIVGLPVVGLNRKNPLQWITFAWKFFSSKRTAKKIVKDFAPDAVIGVGGYASAPTLDAASSLGIPTFLQEQNSFAGKANKMLAKKARKICVAYEGMERFFPKDRIILTGNPVRQNLADVPYRDAKALEAFGLDPAKKTLLIIGGSLGARTVNESVIGGLEKLKNAGIQVIWQTGKYYFESAKAEADKANNPLMNCTAFVKNMDQAYAVADLVISRAGASSISELCLLHKPCILVPSPNVAEDHQTKNALALSTKNAAILVKDADAASQLIDCAISTINDDNKLSNLAENIAKLEEKDSAARIADIILKEID
ncbi:MAG: undecaprenyldiphospho-muramoylpentapeptide beta-N-acetylglucosaminyltransferase [Paludibacteraceae bacterium]|nr:undecaprenyldiphospho-muramoylpentapeptide beta-N-acetylglucosaminyltransferase [Paludibacteraceae bacterium]